MQLHPQVLVVLAELATRLQGEPHETLETADREQLLPIRKAFEQVALAEEELRARRRDVRKATLDLVSKVRVVAAALEDAERQFSLEDARREDAIDVPVAGILEWFEQMGVR